MAIGIAWVFQWLLNGQRDRLVSFRGGGWIAIGIVRCLSEVSDWPEG